MRIVICEVTCDHFIYEYSDSCFMVLYENIKNYISDTHCIYTVVMFVVWIEGKKKLIIIMVI